MPHIRPIIRVYGGPELPSPITKHWQQMLNNIAAHNAPAELSRGDSTNVESMVAYRSRVFEILEDGCIIVETPRQAVFDHSFGNGDDVEADANNVCVLQLQVVEQDPISITKAENSHFSAMKRPKNSSVHQKSSICEFRIARPTVLVCVVVLTPLDPEI